MLQSGSHFCAYCYCSIHPVSACCSTCITPTLSHSFSFLFSMSSHGKGKYLSKGQRINIIEKLSKQTLHPNNCRHMSMMSVKNQYTKLGIIPLKLNNDAHWCLKLPDPQCIKHLLGGLLRLTIYFTDGLIVWDVLTCVFHLHWWFPEQKNCWRAFNLRKWF